MDEKTEDTPKREETIEDLDVAEGDAEEVKGGAARPIDKDGE